MVVVGVARRAATPTEGWWAGGLAGVPLKRRDSRCRLAYGSTQAWAAVIGCGGMGGAQGPGSFCPANTLRRRAYRSALMFELMIGQWAASH